LKYGFTLPLKFLPYAFLLVIICLEKI
jgi:hypothetical protein